MIDLYYSPTPNGLKIPLMLQEIGLPYHVVKIDIFKGEQLTPEYGRINPNHKIPAIVDHEPQGGGAEPLAIFESAAILQYLADKSGKLLAAAGRERWSALQWLAWQVAGVGPMSGQAAHFWRNAPDEAYSIARYTKEVDRLFTVQERRLEQVDYMAGGSFTIADIALFPLRHWFPKTGMIAALGKSGDPYPATTRWYERVLARPAVKRALTIPELMPPALYTRPYTGPKQTLSEQEWSNLYGERQHEAVKK
jgi:GSH-dependent disulfide-bond oxidoreductase